MSLWPFFLFLSAGPLQASEATPTITLRYAERPPFVVEEKGAIYGDTATPAIDAFTLAQIPFHLVSTPTSRQLLLIKNNQGYDCGFGWFKTPERETFAIFSDAIYEDSPWILLTNKKVSIHEKSLASVLKRKDLKLLSRENFSYGAYLDSLIQKEKPQQFFISGSSEQMLQMVHAQRADYIFISQREAEYLIPKLALPKSDFQFLSFPEVPKGDKRYIMCSKRVPAAVIEKLNQSLKRLHSSSVGHHK